MEFPGYLLRLSSSPDLVIITHSPTSTAIFLFNPCNIPNRDPSTYRPLINGQHVLNVHHNIVMGDCFSGPEKAPDRRAYSRTGPRASEAKRKRAATAPVKDAQQSPERTHSSVDFNSGIAVTPLL